MLAARLRRRDDREPSAGRWAQQDITVSGRNIDGVTLTLQHGMMLTGVVLADAGGGALTGGVWLTPAPDSRFLAEPVFRQAAIGEGSRFTMKNVVPGRF